MLLALALLAAGCARPMPALLPGPVPPAECATSSEVVDSIFLVGSAGEPALPKHPEAELPVDPLLRNLQDDVIEQAGALGVARVAVVYLGDNVEPEGLAPVGLSGRARGERVLRQQITAAGPARVVFVAGDRDWGRGGSRGWERVRAQQGFLSVQGERVAMAPAGGCSGPERIDFGAYLRLVFFDPLGLEHALAAPGRHAEACTPATAEEALLALDREVEGAAGRHLVLALHPSLAVREDGAGAVAVHGRAPEPRGGTGRTAGVLQRALRPRRPLLVASGSPHNLQLHRDAAGAYYLVSGGGSPAGVEAVAAAPSALYAEATPGYARLDVHADGALSLSLTAVRGERRETVLRHCLAEGPPS